MTPAQAHGVKVEGVDIDAINEWFGLSASVIKSGEPWTATCERVHRNGRAAVDLLIAEHRELLAAAQAVVERWDSPLWKDAEPTATIIHRLRSALSKAKAVKP